MEIRAISINLTERVGADDGLLWVRVVPDGRDGKFVFARTLRIGEPDLGIPVTIDPSAGETLHFKPGSVEISISHIDQHAQREADGFAPISNTLWTWLTIGSPVSMHVYHHLFAAGRRLDGIHSLLGDVILRMESLSGGFVHQRQQFLTALALAEILVVALGRTIDLADRLRQTFSVTTAFPQQLSAKLEPIRDLRNAFEHIEDQERWAKSAGSQIQTHIAYLTSESSQQMVYSRTARIA